MLFIHERVVNFNGPQINDIKGNLNADEKELRFMSRPFKKKEDGCVKVVLNPWG